MTPTNNPLSERITKNYAQLTKNDQRLADYLQINPEKILILSTNEIAEACLVSKTSVSRFIRKLGYEDHLALRNELLAARDKGEPLSVTALEDSEFRQEVHSLEQLWAQLSGMNLEQLIKKIATAKRVKIIGYRNSYPLALHFRQQLMQCRSGVDLLPLPGQTIGEDLSSIDEDDFIIIIGIRRRVSNFANIISQLSGHDCLLITDQSGQKYAQSVSHFLVCYMNNQAPLDSYAVPMSLISHLVNKTYRLLSSEAVKISRKISMNYSKLNELE
ncbi:DNA-binding helix-turn-helix domain-containing transcriptional regulator protein [Psychromonas ingrahamii 37]|uniref:DNA-binding helix-turn-helix domain-containing transcriptional regulator protein n=1 Tax=Psychromonas ingrahamii (strain DSM 17664 / CCUG 51855 / 37) TaxID=357804 RepID=A1SXE5_PSYIN|nr:MurR/RpiR family transcriptional regulator [Psychromonas ingrahamii]ABM04160.1 DNA-binding helix-turn-helix domain-containing transcriptional regulator protein [Psychromonas ingrahamii 37]